MNNKGFAITTILYGIMILFCVLLVSLLGILSSYKKVQTLLVEESNGAREVITYHKEEIAEAFNSNLVTRRGKYLFESNGKTYCMHLAKGQPFDLDYAYVIK